MNPFQKLIAARLPQAAVALSGEAASVVQLERRGGGLAVRSAGLLPLPTGLVRPSFDEQNVSDVTELAGALSELLTSAGLARRKRWSVGLPEASTRTSILTMETAPGSRAEADEMLRWKTERALGAPLDELRVSRERLRPDAQGRARYLVAAVRLTVLAEYEEVFAALGWHTGLVVPRHMGEAWWLMRDGGGDASARAKYGASDSLLVSSHAEGFTAVILRGGAPLYVRGVVCETEDRADELYRFLLFYRDRTSPQAAEDEEAPPATPTPYGESIGRMLVAGTGIDETQASAIVEETLNVPPRAVQPADLRLAFPSSELDFRHIAAPAGLAALAWA